MFSNMVEAGGVLLLMAISMERQGQSMALWQDGMATLFMILRYPSACTDFKYDRLRYEGLSLLSLASAYD